LKLGKNATETYALIETVIGDDSLGHSVRLSGRPSKSRTDDVVAKIGKKVRNDRGLTVHKLADEAEVDRFMKKSMFAREDSQKTLAK